MNAAAPEIAHGLETPYPLQPCQNYFRLEGWALLRGGSVPTRVRVRCNGATHAPTATPPRADVAALYPEDEFAGQSGFQFVIYLPFGNHPAVLEAAFTDSDTWHPVRRVMVPVSSHPLMGAFEPAGTDGLITETLRPSGWVWHPEFKLDRVELLFGDMALPVEFGLERPDVASRFPDQPAALRSGFILAENLPRGRGPIRLQVKTACGRTYFLDPELEAKLPTGTYAPPRPPRDMWELPPTARPADFTPPPIPANPAPTGPHNILFVLYGDFTSNSAAHVAAFANGLIGRGYDCIVAVPEHAETIGALTQARFLAVEYADLGDLAGYYRDGRGPAVVHAWTTRERVRHFCEEARRRFQTELVFHLEDNERELLANHLQVPYDSLDEIPSEDLDARVPLDLTHPRRASEVLQSARGVTVIIDRLAEFVPAGIPTIELWPAADTPFQPLPRNLSLRRQLGIADDELAVFYHGNAHASNAAEMVELYAAVLRLNQTGVKTWLVRAGRDEPAFAKRVSPEMDAHLIKLGFIKHRRVPHFMSLADAFVQPGAAGAFNDYRFPSKLPEFFAIGRPVILPRTNLGHHLVDDRDALVLDQADASSIAAALRRLHDNPAQAATLGQGAVTYSENHFDWSATVARLETFLLAQTQLQPPGDARLQAARNVTAALTSP